MSDKEQPKPEIEPGKEPDQPIAPIAPARPAEVPPPVKEPPRPIPADPKAHAVTCA